MERINVYFSDCCIQIIMRHNFINIFSINNLDEMTMYYLEIL